MKKSLLFLSLCTAALLCGTAHGRQTTTPKVFMVEKPVPLNTVKNIEGFFGHRMDLNRNNFIKAVPIDEYVRFIEDRQWTDWSWTMAEQHGKWIESGFLSALQSGDRELMAKVDTMLNRIIDSQEEEGYVGATARSYRSPDRPLRGMDAYELYFVLHAFLTVYEETGNLRALEAAEKLGGYFIRYIGPGKEEFWPSDLRYPENVGKEVQGFSKLAGHAVHYSWEGAMLNDPMFRLYQLTGEPRYMEWASWAVDNIDKWSGWDSFSRLDEVADGKIGVHELQPYVHSHTFHMNFMGFLRRYCITGDESLLRKVKGAWDDINERQMYITGGVSVSEHYEQGYVKPLTGSVVETCATMSWMQITQMLLELTGDTKYADAMERLMINHVFAAQSCDGGGIRYHTPPNGVKPEGYFRGPDCCSGSGHRIISLLPTFFYCEGDDGFYINQYLPAEYDGDDFAFEVNTSYPEDGKIEIVVTSDKKIEKTLNLRIPAWCKDPKIHVNNQKIQGVHPGSYAVIPGKWRKGDRITIEFPMKLEWVKREHHSGYKSDVLPGGEHMHTEAAAEQVPYALVHGPTVYALDMVWNKDIEDKNAASGGSLHIDTSAELTQVAKPDRDMLGPVFRTEASYNGARVPVIMAPFSNIGRWYENAADKPEKGAVAYTYAIWLYDK